MEALACPVCGLTGSHGDRSHQVTALPDRLLIKPGPDITITDLLEPLRTGGSLDEQARRARMRAIADRPPDIKRQWRWGTCQRCGTETLVIGPDVQPLCVYCDELRILPPLPAPKTPEQTRAAVRAALREPARPARSPVQRRRSERRAIAWFCCLGLVMLSIPTELAQTLAACLFGLAILYGLSSW
jgi:hypothetical protein